jgi:hypothetical protein
MTGHDSGGRMLASYRMHPMYLVPIFIVFPLFAIVAVVTIVMAVRDPAGGSLGFTLLWTAGVAWNAYWFLFRLCHRIDLYEDALYWSTPLRHGRLDLHSLTAVRPGRIGWGIAVFESTAGQNVLTLPRRGFAQFAAAVQTAAPHASVDIGLYARIAERFPGFNGFRPGDRK